MPSSPFQRGYFQLGDFPDLRLKLCESLLCADPDFGPFSFGPDDTLEVISSSAGYEINTIANNVPNRRDPRMPKQRELPTDDATVQGRRASGAATDAV